ncbi:hypothetical protein C4J81_12240 [Deltaproteobacteria bacterium Smac51]|nr:hypothetical protein C4J81_12240 [Deltaproteobacteria bacterium Smac51]
MTLFYILFLTVCTLFPAALQAAPANALTRAAIGSGPDYARLVFTFKDPLETYVLRRTDVDKLVIDLGPASFDRSMPMPSHPLIPGVAVSQENGRLIANIDVAPVRYELRHFQSRDQHSLVIDIKNVEEEAPQATQQPQGLDIKPLAIPTLPEMTEILTLTIPPRPPEAGPDQAENLYHRILKELAARYNQEALADLEEFVRLFPNHQLIEPVSYLLGEAYYLNGTPQDTYAQATNAWRSALEKWPQSTLAPRARFMLAQADQDLGYNNEAAAQFKLIADDALNPDDIYARVALLRATDLLLNMGLIDEARKTLEPVLEQGLADDLGLESYARLGMADFYQGFYSQANEIFREALRLAPDLYLNYPDMMYAIGEGYHYLDRPDLSRMFLMHTLNLMPNHPKADVIMARIGDNYRKEGRDKDAMAIYGAARRHFPNGDGGLISQVRLADMGALHSFFRQDKVFDALERGTRQATVEMYKQIVDTGSTSPLLQLAQLKIGAALHEDGENHEAIKWLRELEINNPKSPLLAEALPLLNRSLLSDVALRRELGEWQAIADIYADNSSYIEDADRPAVLRVVAEAYEKLGRYADAREIWRELEEQTPEKRLERAKGLVVNSIMMDKPNEALDYLLALKSEFPDEVDWTREHLARIEKDLARPGNAQATEDLLRFRTLTDEEPMRQEALSDAVSIELGGQRYDKASALMDQYRREYPDDDLTREYLLTQSQIEDRQRRYDNSWDKLSEFRVNYPDDPRVAELLRSQIQRADSLGRPDDAFRFMELYRGRYPDNPESRNLLIEKMNREWDMGRYPESRESLNAFRREYPGDPAIPQLLMNRADSDWGLGRYDDSQWAADELLLNYPNDPRVQDYLIERARRDWAAQRYDQSQAMVDQLMRSFPGDSRLADLLLERAGGDWGRGRIQAAQKDWDDFRRAFPDDPRVGPSYVDQYKKSIAGGLTDPAFQLAEEYRLARPEDVSLQADLMLEQARDYFAVGRSNDGLGLWTRFRETYPDDSRVPDLLLIQARQEMKESRFEDALKHYQEFINQYPDNALTPSVYLETAAAETRLGRQEDAWNHLDRFQKLYPEHVARPKAILDQVETGRSLGRYDDAIELYRQFRREYPNAPEFPATFLAQARLEISSGRPQAAVDTLEEGILTSPQLDSEPQVQALLTDLYLEVGRIDDWAALVERNLDRDPTPSANLADRFLKYNQLAQVHLELDHPADAERNFDSAIANRPPNVSPETLYAIAGSYKRLLRPEKYAGTLAMVRDSGDPFWQKIATDELASLEPSNPQ